MSSEVEIVWPSYSDIRTEVSLYTSHEQLGSAGPRREWSVYNLGWAEGIPHGFWWVLTNESREYDSAGFHTEV